MKNKLIKVLVFALAAIMLFGTVSSFAYKPYETYTYSIDGELLESPMAYTPALSIGSDVTTFSSSSNVSDMFCDENGFIYLVETSANRIVVLDDNYNYVREFSTYIDEYKQAQTFNAPEAIFVTDPNKSVDGSSYIYVGDTGNKRIVVFDRDFNYVRTIGKPDNALVTEAFFRPQAIAVDIYGRIFITSTACVDGVIVLSSDGEFNGFIGAQKVTYTIWEMIINRFKSPEDRAKESLKLPDAYNNITVDDEGFLYATIKFSQTAELSKQLASITSKDASFSPVKKFNSMGDHILKRNGFFDPGGEVNVFDATELSEITDVALGAEGAWTILDTLRCRTYTYDQNGQLLYAFGGKGYQLGNCARVDAMAYQVVDKIDKNGEFVYDEEGNIAKEYRLLLLDFSPRANYTINVYTPTEYADAITNALANENNHNHAEAVEAWQGVLTMNNNFDLAYIGIGKALYYQGRYEEAMEMLKGAYDVDYYALAYGELRKDIIGKWMIPIIIGVVIIVVLVLKFLGWCKKKNKEASVRAGKKKYWEELIFAFHLIFHPFDGFWDLKHEKRGSVRGASTILALAVVAFYYQSVGQGYMFNPRPSVSNIIVQVMSIAMPVLLWSVSNWCLTALFEGEGSFKDIYIATCYSLTPLVILVPVATVLTNVLSSSEATVISLITGIATVWMILLVFFGMVVTHDYSITKNFLIMICSIVVAAVIIFVLVLFAGLITKMYSFIDSIITEISYRL